MLLELLERLRDLVLLLLQDVRVYQILRLNLEYAVHEVHVFSQLERHQVRQREQRLVVLLRHERIRLMASSRLLVLQQRRRHVASRLARHIITVSILVLCWSKICAATQLFNRQLVYNGIVAVAGSFAIDNF